MKKDTKFKGLSSTVDYALVSSDCVSVILSHNERGFQRRAKRLLNTGLVSLGGEVIWIGFIRAQRASYERRLMATRLAIEWTRCAHSSSLHHLKNWEERGFDCRKFFEPTVPIDFHLVEDDGLGNCSITLQFKLSDLKTKSDCISALAAVYCLAQRLEKAHTEIDLSEEDLRQSMHEDVDYCPTILV